MHARVTCVNHSGLAHEKLQALVASQRSLTHLLSSLAAAANRGPGPLSIGILAANRVLIPREFVRARVTAYFRNYVHAVSVFDTYVERPSIALRKIVACAGVLRVRHTARRQTLVG